jgi:hypothetical protein
MTALVIIDTRSGSMRRYEGRRRTHKVTPCDQVAYPLSAAYVPVINDFIRDPDIFMGVSHLPQGAA